jgi:uncharacterized protein YjiS (DUF1127 family)
MPDSREATGSIGPGATGARRQWRGGFVAALAAAVHRAAEAFDDCRQRHMLRLELAEMAAGGDFDRMLADVGISRSQIPVLLSAHPGAARRLGGAMRRIGIDPARIRAGWTLSDIEWTCTTCRSQRSCRKWLTSGAREDYRAFCPNAASFDRLRAEQRRSPVQPH